jgi:hypothetical protein
LICQTPQRSFRIAAIHAQRSISILAMTGSRTKPPYAVAGIADAEFARNRSTLLMIAQRASSLQPFMGFVLIGAKTVLSQHAFRTNKSRHIAVIRFLMRRYSIACNCGGVVAAFQFVIRGQSLLAGFGTQSPTLFSQHGV